MPLEKLPLCHSYGLPSGARRPQLKPLKPYLLQAEQTQFSQVLIMFSGNASGLCALTAQALGQLQGNLRWPLLLILPYSRMLNIIKPCHSLELDQNLILGWEGCYGSLNHSSTLNSPHAAIISQAMPLTRHLPHFPHALPSLGETPIEKKSWRGIIFVTTIRY